MIGRRLWKIATGSLAGWLVLLTLAHAQNGPVTTRIVSPADGEVRCLRDLPVEIQSTFGLTAFVDLSVNKVVVFTAEVIAANGSITLTVPKARLVLGTNELQVTSYYMEPSNPAKHGTFTTPVTKITVVGDSSGTIADGNKQGAHQLNPVEQAVAYYDVNCACRNADGTVRYMRDLMAAVDAAHVGHPGDGWFSWKCDESDGVENWPYKLTGEKETPSTKTKIVRIEITETAKDATPYGITMPRWVQMTAKNPKDKPGEQAATAWDAFCNALLGHENGHKAKFTKFLEEARAAVDAHAKKVFWGEACYDDAAGEADARQRAKTLAQAERDRGRQALLTEMRAVLARYTAEDAAYETATDHGATQSNVDANAANTTVDGDIPLQENPLQIMERPPANGDWGVENQYLFRKELGTGFGGAGVTRVWSITQGKLPWMSLDNEGNWKATPVPARGDKITAAKQYNITVQLTETLNGKTMSDTYAFAWTVNPVTDPVIASPPALSGKVGVAITHTFAKQAGTGFQTAGATRQWAAGGNVPAGFTLNAQTGAMSFTPTRAGKFSIIIGYRETWNGVTLNAKNIQVTITVERAR